MDLKELKFNWNKFGQLDPFWAILTCNSKKGNKWNSDEFFATGRQEIDYVINYINTLGIKFSTKRALDFGCGAGRLSQALALHFDEVYGVDISPSMLKLAHQYNNYRNKVKYCLNDQDNLNLFSSEFFNFIYSNITLQHMEARYSKKYIQEFLRLLAPEGILIFQIPSEPVLPIKTINEVAEQKKIVPQLREQIKKKVPSSLVDLYRQIRYGNDTSKRATMEMYGIKKDDVIKLIQEIQGIEIIDIKQNTNAGNQWISFQYCVKKY